MIGHELLIQDRQREAQQAAADHRLTREVRAQRRDRFSRSVDRAVWWVLRADVADTVRSAAAAVQNRWPWRCDPVATSADSRDVGRPGRDLEPASAEVDAPAEDGARCPC